MKMEDMDEMKDIIDAAKREDWGYVDKRIPRICNIEKVQDRAVELLKNPNGNLRDLGASIIGKANIPAEKFSKIKPVLKEIMIKDPNIYAKYRAAFALAEHCSGNYDQEIIKVLKKAAQDQDVGEIAKEYLKR